MAAFAISVGGCRWPKKAASPPTQVDSVGHRPAERPRARGLEEHVDELGELHGGVVRDLVDGRLRDLRRRLPVAEEGLQELRHVLRLRPAVVVVVEACEEVLQRRHLLLRYE